MPNISRGDMGLKPEARQPKTAGRSLSRWAVVALIVAAAGCALGVFHMVRPESASISEGGRRRRGPGGGVADGPAPGRGGGQRDPKAAAVRFAMALSALDLSADQLDKLKDIDAATTNVRGKRAMTLAVLTEAQREKMGRPGGGGLRRAGRVVEGAPNR